MSDSALLTRSELEEVIGSLVERFEEAGQWPPVLNNGIPYGTASALRSALPTMGVTGLIAVRRQLAEAEGKLLQREQRERQWAEQDAAVERRRGPLTAEEQAEVDERNERARLAAEESNSTAARLGRIEGVLERVAGLLERR